MKITLPDGSTQEHAPGTTPRQVAEGIGQKLAADAIGAKVNGQLVDVTTPIEHDATLELITRPKTDKQGRSKWPGGEPNPDALWLLRHSTAHVMAEAIQRLWPSAQLAYGPPVENGFYYDLALDEPISSDDFLRIEQEMRKIVEEDRPFTRYELEPETGMEKLKQEGNKYKIDNAERAVNGGATTLSWYVTGEVDLSEIQNPKSEISCWEDLCQGPHLPSTGYIGAFKLMSVASSHWHGDVTSDRFQRVYGTAFFTQQDLDDYLKQLEEARQRDHRVIGQRLGLFTIDEQVGQGLILWKPKGARVRSILEDFIKNELLKRGYQVVYTPHIGKTDLYKTSGHFPYYQDSQFPPITMGDGEQYLLKPMNCPHHIKIFASDMHSYRDLPVRMAEFGTVYRFEQSGELAGLTRVRGFTQDDAHIFCTEDQVKGEFRHTVELVQFVFQTFGFHDVTIRLSLREPGSDKYQGDPAVWDRAERELREVLEEMGVAYVEEAGEAAFYGPKVDFVVRDVLNREWQLGTVQLDYNLPRRFGLQYKDADNAMREPIMIHRAPFGSLERFMGILIEHYNGAFPLWLAPEQMRVLPISDKFLDYARQVEGELAGRGFRVTVDRSSDRINNKIRIAQQARIPYMLVVGGKDEQNRTVSVRDRDEGDLGAMAIDQFIDKASAEARHADQPTAASA